MTLKYALGFTNSGSQPSLCSMLCTVHLYAYHVQQVLLICNQPIISSILFISKTEVSDSFRCSCMHVLPSHQICTLDVLQ